MAGDDARRTGPAALSDLFDGALETLAARRAELPAGAADGILFSGNRHESVPRQLFLDRRLTPLERNAWLMFRLPLTGDGLNVFPTYEQLRTWLSSTPCGALASHETVARALTLLRLTRWLSLARRRRDPKTGRMLGNVYVLHDEPLTPFEAMQLDASYLDLVSQSLSHAAKAVRIVGMETMREIASDPMIGDRALPTRLQVIARRLLQGQGNAESYPQDSGSHESEDGAGTLLRHGPAPSSVSEAGAKPASNHGLRNPKPDRPVPSTCIDKEVRTVPRVPRVSAMAGLKLPGRFTRLKPEQQTGALMALRQVDEALRQAVLDEWDARCDGSAIRNPAGYLFGIAQKAIKGEFKAWAGERQPVSPPPPPSLPVTPPAPEPKRASPEVVRQHLARAREMLGRPSTRR